VLGPLGCSSSAATAITLYIAFEAVGGRLTLGDLALYTSAAASVQTSVAGLFTAFTGMYENNLYLDTLYRFLSTQPRITAPAEPRPLPATIKGHIQFDAVSFTYPGADNPALDEVSFEIRPGETVAVVGRNGAGKSTLFKLLCRLYDPTAGRILLDGVDIRDYDPDELRTQITAMFQDYVTYQGTAAENIGLGDLTRLENRPHIEESARRAGVADRISELPNTYRDVEGSPADRIPHRQPHTAAQHDLRFAAIRAPRAQLRSRQICGAAARYRRLVEQLPETCDGRPRHFGHAT
jgi:ATP-binding cassette subfamily B protein